MTQTATPAAPLTLAVGDLIRRTISYTAGGARTVVQVVRIDDLRDSEVHPYLGTVLTTDELPGKVGGLVLVAARAANVTIERVSPAEARFIADATPNRTSVQARRLAGA